MYKIRLAHQEDWPKLAPMCEAFYGFSGNPIPYDEDSAHAQFIDSVAGPGAVILAETDEEDVVGMLSFLTHPFPVNRNVIVGTEMCWWVDPTHRGGPVADALRDTAEAIAKQVYNAQYFTMSKLHNSHKAIDRYYKKSGYQETEASFMKAL